MIIKLNKKNKLISNILLISFAFLAFICNTKAKPYTTKNYDTSYPNCKYESGCMILCSYTNPNRDIVNQNYIPETLGYIGYHYKYKIQGDTTKWEIVTHRYPTFYYFDNIYLPSDNIYFNKSEKTWKSTDAYKQLSEQYKCPEYFSHEEDEVAIDAMELCFASDEKSCLKNGEADFEVVGPLQYDFIEDEFKKVIDDALGTKVWGAPEIQMTTNKSLVFLNNIGLFSGYDSSTTEEKNLEKVCNVLKKKDNGNLEEVIINEQHDRAYIENILNPKLKESASKNNAKYPEVFTYDNIVDFLITGYSNDKPVIATEIKDSMGTSYYDKLNNSYTENLIAALSHISNECNKYEEYQIDIDVNELNDLQTESANDDLIKKYTINFDEKLDCDSIFGGEVAEIIKTAYFLIEMAAIIITVVFTSLDYAKAILNGEQEEMKKNNQKLMKRIIIVVIIFLLPALVNLILGIFNIEGFNSDNPLCVKISNK